MSITPNPKIYHNFFDIYPMVMSKIEDTDLELLKERDIFLYLQKMYLYLVNAIGEYTIPSSIYPILSDKVDPSFNDKEYVLSNGINIVVLDDTMLPNEDNICRFKYNGEDIEYIYNEVDKTISIDILLPDGEIEGVGYWETYFCGKFNTGITERQCLILTSWMAYIWAVQVSNNKDDIERLLLDTDFQMASEASVTKSKLSWVNSFREKADYLMNSTDWGYTFLTKSIDNRPPMKY